MLASTEDLATDIVATRGEKEEETHFCKDKKQYRQPDTDQQAGRSCRTYHTAVWALLIPSRETVASQMEVSPGLLSTAATC